MMLRGKGMGVWKLSILRRMVADGSSRAYENLCYLVDKYAPWPADLSGRGS